MGLQMLSKGFSDYNQRIVVLVGLYITLPVSLNLINGITGQFSIGHAAFYQVGAYTAGFLTLNYFASPKVQNFLAKLHIAIGSRMLVCVLLRPVVGATAAPFSGLVVGM